MIFDRTLADVRRAKKIINNLVKKEITLTAEERDILERGRVTLGTINRIEYNQLELKAMLEYMGYYNIPISNKIDWADDEFFKEEDLKRLVKNNKVLREAFFALKSSPPNAVAKYHYEEFNALEKILHDLIQNANNTMSKYRRCGTFNCGG